MHALAGAASTWDADGRPDEDLYRGARLDAVLAWRDAAGPSSPSRPRSSRHPRHSSGRRRRDRASCAARPQAEPSTARPAGAAVALFAVAVTAGGFVAAGSNETAQQRETAQIEALTSAALSLGATERDVAALLAVEAYRRWPEILVRAPR